MGKYISRASIQILVLLISFVISSCGGSGGANPTDGNKSNAILTSISVTPTNPSIAKGTSQQFTATGTYSDNTTKDLTTSVNWSSSTAGVAFIGNTGVATTVGTGTTSIVALDTASGISGATNLTVTSAQLVSIDITPTNISIAKGTNRQFTATGIFSNNTTQDLTAQVTWSSSNTGIASIEIATVDTKGLATGIFPGTTTITATSGTVSGNATLTVTVFITEFSLSPVGNPVDITAGPDGNLWFTEAGFAWHVCARGEIEKITPSGMITEFPLPTDYLVPSSITTGPDGNLWFTEVYCIFSSGPYPGGKIGKITPSGIITEFPLPVNTYPGDITTGPDGSLWFTGYATNNIGAITTSGVGKITTSGVITEFPIPTANAFPGNITTGPDGNLWFTEGNANQIGKITTSGVITEFPIPTANAFPGNITTGPDGNLWFTEGNANQIGKITTSGVITEFPIPTANSQPCDITTGPDGNLWFTECYLAFAFPGYNNIGKITTSGVITEFPFPSANVISSNIATGPDGNLWFTEDNLVNRIGKFILPAIH